MPSVSDPTVPNPLRVLYVARAPFISGAERALASMLRHLDRIRVEPMVVLGTHTPLIDQLDAMGIPHWVVPLPKRSRYRPLAWHGSRRRLSAAVDSFKPHLLHANDVPSCQALSIVGEKKRLPRVVHIRWEITADDAAWWAYRGAECVICISQWIRDRLGDTSNTVLKRSNIEVLPDAVDWPATPAQHTPPPSTRNTSTPIALGFAGQLIESKGLDLVIEAIGRLPKDAQPRLLVAGQDTQTQGRYHTHLVQLAQKCGVTQQIQWLGFLDDVSQLYRQVAAVVCPSQIEPLGLVPLEAAQFGLPTLANRVGGLVETIQHGTTGYLIDPTVEAWAQALRQLQNVNRLAQMGQAAYERTRHLYAPAVYQQRLMVIYQGLIAAVA